MNGHMHTGKSIISCIKFNQYVSSDYNIKKLCGVEELFRACRSSSENTRAYVGKNQLSHTNVCSSKRSFRVYSLSEGQS